MEGFRSWRAVGEKTLPREQTELRGNEPQEKMLGEKGKLQCIMHHAICTKHQKNGYIFL
uniref:Uncharacterized protein n=1 Tax=Colobus angolensis palliatus TaxID=336983 RepID=A0A2K5JIW6_COLAP